MPLSTGALVLQYTTGVCYTEGIALGLLAMDMDTVSIVPIDTVFISIASYPQYAYVSIGCYALLGNTVGVTQ